MLGGQIMACEHYTGYGTGSWFPRWPSALTCDRWGTKVTDALDDERGRCDRSLRPGEQGMVAVFPGATVAKAAVLCPECSP